MAKSAMKLITEQVTTDTVEVLVESNEQGGKAYYIKGPFLQSEVKNRNGRIYPQRIMEREVARYTKELIAEHRALGELGHPDTPSINFERVSHIITELKQDGNDYLGKAKILDSPFGKITKSLIDEDVKFGVSSRGLGSLTNTPQGNVVGEDFYLATAADIVHDPSAPNAFVRGIMENKEWVWDNGIIKESHIAAIKRELIAAPRRRTAVRQLTEAKLFAKFLNAIRVKTSIE